MFTPAEFKEYWPDILVLGKAAGDGAGTLYALGLPVAKEMFPTPEEFRDTETRLDSEKAAFRS